jgi:hypothetical protein
MATPQPTRPPVQYDIVIVGGGPTGLTIATHLAGTAKVLVVEQNDSIGGCHYVDRHDDGLFSEHGPRVYSGAYVNMRNILECIGVSWDSIFTPCTWSPDLIDGKVWYGHFSTSEILAVSAAFLAFAVSKEWAKGVSVATWTKSHGFSPKSRRYMDLVCRFSDGAGSARYSMYEFLSGFNEHIPYGFYEPREPLDTTLWPAWQSYLESAGVAVSTGTHVVGIDARTITTTSNGRTGRVGFKKLILAIPPYSAHRLLPSEPGLAAFAKATRYDEYWSLSCHYASQPTLPRGQITTPWGLVFIGMPFQKEKYWVVSISASVRNVKSPVTGKTLKATSDEADAAAEIVRQFRAATGCGAPDRVTYTEPKYWDHDAFVASAGAGYFGPELSMGNVYTVGPHNGASSYHFTSFESAVQNAMAFVGKSPKTARTVLGISLFFIVVVLCFVCGAATGGITKRVTRRVTRRVGR